MHSPDQILVSQRNALYRILEHNSLQPEQFILTFEPKMELEWLPNIKAGTAWGNSVKIEHTHYRFYFQFDVTDNTNNFIDKHWPGSTLGTPSSTLTLGWDKLVEVFTSWAKRVAREIAEPDLWGPGFRILSPAYSWETMSNEPFLEEEKLAISQKLGLLGNEIKRAYALSEQQYVGVAEKLDYLGDGLSRLGKRDWAGITFTTLISIGITLSLDTDRGRQLFQLAHDILFNKLVPLIN